MTAPARRSAIDEFALAIARVHQMFRDWRATRELIEKIARASVPRLPASASFRRQRNKLGTIQSFLFEGWTLRIAAPATIPAKVPPCKRAAVS